MTKKKLGLHEVMVLCMVRKRRFTMTTAELARLNAQWDLYRRPKDGAFPEAWQLFLRGQTKGYRWLFQVVGDQDAATVTMKCSGAPKARR